MNVLIADHNGLFREGLRALMMRLEQTRECLEVDSIDAMHDVLLDRHDIRLLVLDLDLLTPGNMRELKLIKERWPRLGVVLLTRNQDILTMRDAFALGISGYLLKSENTAVFEHAFKLILAGGVYVSEKFICEPVVDRDQSLLATLTPRQQQVLELVADGLSNKEIGRLLALAEGTVKAHVAALLKSIGVKNRTQAANWARDKQVV